MLQYLQIDDIRYIVGNAPSDFSLWILKQKYKDYEAMSEDEDNDIRRLGLIAKAVTTSNLKRPLIA